MRELRAALLAIPPLLTELIRSALMSRAPITVASEVTDVQSLAGRENAIDIVLLGSPDLLGTVRVVTTAEILVLSEDLRDLRWPRAGQTMPLRIETLISTLERVGEDLDLQSQSNPDL